MKTLPNNSLKRSLRSAPWPSPPGQAVQAAATPYVVLRPLHPSPCPPAGTFGGYFAGIPFGYDVLREGCCAKPNSWPYMA